MPRVLLYVRHLIVLGDIAMLLDVAIQPMYGEGASLLVHMPVTLPVKINLFAKEIA